jgi:hypothetical protein
MLKDIPKLEVENLVIAAVRETVKNPLLDDQSEEGWGIYLINLYDQPIEGVLVSSKGYGSYEGRDVKTSVLRHLIGTIAAHDFAKVEPIMANVFGLNNEYWVSFYLNKNLYDKKYIFLPETILKTNFTMIPVLNKRGVMIR